MQGNLGRNKHNIRRFGKKNNNKKMLVFTSEAEGPVLLVVDRGRRVVEVHRPQRRRVDGVLRVVHPQAVSHLAK